MQNSGKNTPIDELAESGINIDEVWKKLDNGHPIDDDELRALVAELRQEREAWKGRKSDA